jgi:hypothetical protein
VDDAIATYFMAWNEPDPDERRRLLECCVTDDVELFDPLGHWEGVAGLVERIRHYQVAAPGTEIVRSSGVDRHNHVVRYAWSMVDERGAAIADGLDVVEQADDGRLRRILMFHGPLPGAG